MKWIYKTLLLSLFSAISYAKEINVYLKFNDPALARVVSQFNNYLETKGIFNKYQLRPFLDKHPLHLTLFLASYPDDRLGDLKQAVAALARRWGPIKLKTTTIFLTKSNYVMLDIDNNRQANGQNSLLQQLSDETVMRLSGLRDLNAAIPLWAESIPEKRRAFTIYGSPNVFFEYNPHFSLMAAVWRDPLQAISFQKEITQLIDSYPFPKLRTGSMAIALGYVDSFGQITEELASFPLGKKTAA